MTKRRHLTGINPLEGRDLLSASAMKTSDRQRFENEHLVKIFDATTYGENNDKPSDWFLPLLALFTGARINELAQLRVADIIHDVPIPYIFVRATVPTQSLKTGTSRRHIPLHHVLLETGFLDYVAEVREMGFEFVFPHLSYSEASGYAAQASERCNGYLKTAGVKSRTRVFHSFSVTHSAMN